MQRILLTTFGLALGVTGAFAQGYVEDFDDDVDVDAGDNYTVTQEDGMLMFTGNGSTGEDEGVTYTVQVDGSDGTFDISENNIVSVRASASSVGTVLGVELIDADGNETSIGGNVDDLAPELTASLQAATLDFSDNLGEVDASRIAKIKFIGSPGIGDFNATINIDALSLGGELSDGPNFAYIDEFDGDSSITAFTVYPADDGTMPFVNETVAGSGQAVIRGTGVKGGYVDFRYSPRNQESFQPISLDLPAANDKLYIKAKSSVPNTSVRIDAIDSRGYMTADVGITRVLGTEFEVFEYDYNNGYRADRWTPPCNVDTAPCDVDGDDIVSFRIIPDPGQEVFSGTITFEWLTVGESLEPVAEKPLLYTDCFGDDLNNFTSDGNGFSAVETDGRLEITVTEEKPRYGTFTYNLNDRESQLATSVDITEAPTLQIRMRVDGPDATVRIDAVDSDTIASTQTAKRQPVTDEFAVYTYDYAGAVDGGYDGTRCPDGVGTPCDVSLDAISALYFYINDESEDNFTYEGKLIIDEISFGRKIQDGDCNEAPAGNPLGQDGYNDELNGEDNADFFVSYDGSYEVAATDSTLQIIGDGTAGGYQRVRYRFNDGSDTVLVNVAATNEVRVRARVLGVDDARVRVDLIDNEDISTSNAGKVLELTNEFQDFPIDFTDAYVDGGYGGTSCPVSNNENPCDVDAQRISGIYFYPAITDGSGANAGFQRFNGIIEIDRIGAGQVVSVNAAREVADVLVTPNPVTNQLAVSYELAVDGDVAVAIYDGIGREIARQSPGRTAAGNYRHSFDLSGMSAGIYQVVLSVDGYVGKTVSVVKQ